MVVVATGATTMALATISRRAYAPSCRLGCAKSRTWPKETYDLRLAQLHIEASFK